MTEAQAHVVSHVNVVLSALTIMFIMIWREREPAGRTNHNYQGAERFAIGIFACFFMVTLALLALAILRAIVWATPLDARPADDPWLSLFNLVAAIVWSAVLLMVVMRRRVTRQPR